MITITLRLTNIIPMYGLIFLLESSANYSTYKLIKESSKCTLTNNAHIQFYYTQTPIISSKINIFQNRAHVPLPHTPRELRFDFDCNLSDIHCARSAHPFPPFLIFQRGVVSKTSKPFILKNFIKNWLFSKPKIVTSSSHPMWFAIRSSLQLGW